MSTTLAAVLATIGSYVALGSLAVHYAVPRLRSLDVSEALMALLAVHLFRHVALHLFIAPDTGLAISDRTRDFIVYGDQIGFVLAAVSFWALRQRASWAVGVVLLWIVATIADLALAAVEGVREELFGVVSDVTWMTLTFYVPLLWVTTILAIWQIVSRRHELDQHDVELNLASELDT